MPSQRSSSRGRVTPAIGDEVRVSAEVRNEHVAYAHAAGTEGGREPIDGLVVSIREISSGRRVKVAAGDARNYVFDLLDTQTFDPRFSSKINSQGVAAGHIEAGATYGQVQAALRQRSVEAKEVGAEALLRQEPFSALLDGWRLVRVCAAEVRVKA
jgi:hypothetical protein